MSRVSQKTLAEKRADRAAYAREYRKTHPLNEGHRQRDISRSYAGVYERRGKLLRYPCQACGSSKSQKHHPDHELPLFVVWLCRPCHLAWHAHWRETVPTLFAEWLEVARACAAVRKSSVSELHELSRALSTSAA